MTFSSTLVWTHLVDAAFVYFSLYMFLNVLKYAINVKKNPPFFGLPTAWRIRSVSNETWEAVGRPQKPTAGLMSDKLWSACPAFLCLCFGSPSSCFGFHVFFRHWGGEKDVFSASLHLLTDFLFCLVCWPPTFHHSSSLSVFFIYSHHWQSESVPVDQIHGSLLNMHGLNSLFATYVNIVMSCVFNCRLVLTCLLLLEWNFAYLSEIKRGGFALFNIVGSRMSYLFSLPSESVWKLGCNTVASLLAMEMNLLKGLTGTGNKDTDPDLRCTLERCPLSCNEQ